MTPTTLSMPHGSTAARTTATDVPPTTSSTHHRARRLWRGREEDSPLVRPALLGLLLGTGVLYLWSLGDSGWANSFYAAAVQAGTESRKAFFFGSSDAASSITVDKTPFSLWPMVLSARIFGLSSWSMLVPQALMGVASVGVLHLSVRRATGHAWAGIFAGAALALTPVAALMFRFNNPDALLVLLLIGSVYCTQRALQSPARAVRWLVLGGTLVGLAFLTKMLQAFLVLPPLALTYAICAPIKPLVRLRHLLAAFAAMIVSAGWWIAIVELWPASSRPFIGGSQNNSILELTLGYNGFGRLNGNETGSVGGGNGWGETGPWRMFGSDIGGQVAWLLPAAFVLLVAGSWLLRRAARTDLARAGLIVWGTWLVVTTVTFSFMAGIFHAYYTVALAPAIAAVVGIGAAVLWTHRSQSLTWVVAGFSIAVTASTSFILLGRADGFVPWLRWLVIIAGIVAAVLIVLHRVLPRRALVAVAIATLIATLAGPAAYAVDTASTPHTGSIPSAGPSTGRGGGPNGMPTGMPGGPRGTTTQNLPKNQAPPQGQAQRGAGGGGGGLLSGSESTDEINALLEADADQYTWVASAIGSNAASGYQLATGLPVMAIGGFNGSDPSPTLAQFQRYVADGDIHYFIASGGGGGGPSAGGNGTSSQISAWIEENFTSSTVDGVTVYDLSGGVA